MSYRKRVIIFLFTMVATGAILVAAFIHSTTQALESLSASSIPLPALGAQDQQDLQHFLQNMQHTSTRVKQGSQNTNTPPSTPPQDQNTLNAGQQNSGVATPDGMQQIPAKAMQ